jgi:hypothetical protein
VLVAGGTVGLAANGRSAELYDPQRNTWTATPDMFSRHEAAAAALLNNVRVLVVAGADDGIPRGAAEAFDPAIGTNGSWTQACCVGPRILHTATLLADGRVLVAGGWDGNDSLATTPIFDPATGTWSFIDPLTQARDAHTATLLSDGRVLVAGGEVARGGVIEQTLSSVEIRPATG